MADSEDVTPQPVDDIESAYREALRSIDEAEMQVGSALMELVADDDDASLQDQAAFASVGDQLADELESESNNSGTIETVEDGAVRVSPRSVVEAALFVGGDLALTARKLASLIGKDADSRLAVKLIDELNEAYSYENRPYEIRLHEGGFGLELKEKFSDVQTTVFGLGPREVRLSPDVLEVLAFIAYNQPVTKKTFSTLRQKNLQANVRRLIRLRLVEVERTESRRGNVTYRTGQRFLDLFGLDDLSELPQADIFNFK